MRASSRCLRRPRTRALKTAQKGLSTLRSAESGGQTRSTTVLAPRRARTRPTARSLTPMRHPNGRCHTLDQEDYPPQWRELSTDQRVENLSATVPTTQVVDKGVDYRCACETAA